MRVCGLFCAEAARMRKARPMTDDQKLLTIEAIDRDPWAAVYMPLPETPDAALVKGAHHSAEYCYEAALNRAEHPDSPAHSAHEPQRKGLGSDNTPTENVAAALDRMEALEKIDPTLTRVGPHSIEGPPPPDGPGRDGVGEQFRAAQQIVANTPQGQRERDLGQVIDQLAEANGLQDSVELGAFTLAQEMRGDAITRESDPEKRAELRNEREAVAHEYAGALSDRLAVHLRATGNEADAVDMEQHAETRREIADEIRKPTPPERGNDSAAFDDSRATFQTGRQEYEVLRAETAALTGTEAFDADVRAAETRAAAGQGADERPVVEADHIAQNRAEIGAFMGAAPGGTYIYTGQTHPSAEVQTDYEAGPHRPGTEPDFEASALALQNAESAKRQTAELAASQGVAPADAAHTALTGMEAFEADLKEADENAAEIAGNEQDNGNAFAMGGNSL
jgi:hypothetical protein